MATGEYLLEGARYALKQCGLLLRSAVSLYNQKDYANAIVSATFAREEFGRSRILRGLRKQVVEQGKRVSVKDIRKECKDHLAKQESAQPSVVQRTLGTNILAKLLKKLHHVSPQSGDDAGLSSGWQRRFEAARIFVNGDKYFGAYLQINR